MNEIERLDQLSRTRALSDEESLLLERLIRCEGRRVPHGARRELARAGIKRDMAEYRK